jgi:hypothetical protein
MAEFRRLWNSVFSPAPLERVCPLFPLRKDVFYATKGASTLQALLLANSQLIAVVCL